MGAHSDSRFWCETHNTDTDLLYKTNCKIVKYSKMQMHGNVCVHQMSVIFILKIKDYFSSNKADVTHYICLFYIKTFAQWNQ